MTRTIISVARAAAAAAVAALTMSKVVYRAVPDVRFDFMDRDGPQPMLRRRPASRPAGSPTSERPHRPPPSTDADYERLRLAAIKRARKAARLRKELPHG